MMTAAIRPKRLGFFDGLIDGMLGRHFWDPERAAMVKTVRYVLGELWAASTQPLALIAAMSDWNRAKQADEDRDD